MARAAKPRLSEALLASVAGERWGLVSATQPGRVAGLELLDLAAQGLDDAGVWKPLVGEGSDVAPGTPLVEVRGRAAALALAEDHVLGPLGWASGVATRAARIVAAAPGKLRIVCGGWKKLPAALKPLLRAGLAAGGVAPRLVDGDFLYVDKNAVRMLGGVRAAIDAGRRVGHGPVSVQVRSLEEARAAAAAGAGIVMVDSSSLDVLARVHAGLASDGIREDLVLAFGGGVQLERLAAVAAAGADVVDIGREILDAPLLDLRFDVQAGAAP
ncbi:MAG: nicotinate-nucleotide pyrophosphorylase [Proteobacteria bacterium]|nr:nicotinate-nucleotide pyrophosphorylase [Pseudomonadota bacterium]